ncbi:hypothetical protein ACJU26_02745 [Acidithiobacillus sp. M4-SHS-6]|uniref:hypothetical protein n=1 Tax=Acidithiobacillus sp. M4-SHS-6 TaxID=3383024 RepID=UPI0039BE450E
MEFVAKVINGAGLFMGFAGALILWKNSYGFESVPFFASSQEPGGGISKRNKGRKHYQRIGFCCVALGFALQFVGVFI